LQPAREPSDLRDFVWDPSVPGEREGTLTGGKGKKSEPCITSQRGGKRENKLKNGDKTQLLLDRNDGGGGKDENPAKRREEILVLSRNTHCLGLDRGRRLPLSNLRRARRKKRDKAGAAV